MNYKSAEIMNAAQLAQYQFESDTWKRRLFFLLEESVQAKNRIAEILKQPVDMEMVNELEYFQSGFIEKDRLLCALKEELESFDRLLLKRIFEERTHAEQIRNTRKNIRQQMQFAEQSFEGFQKNFNLFLAANIVS
ncbi:MAG TPA: hypothetical protein VL307_18575 [Chitinophagaceae bacterium]|nr:hypothetical protein [Chitinophagaceae bacterium]